MAVAKIRYFIFLRDVLILALTAFGGPQAHIAMFIQRFVEKRNYLTEAELMELNALCQILPGPTSTQTIIAIGFKIGGPNLAYLTLAIWILPAFTLMTTAALMVDYFESQSIDISNFTTYIKPMAVGFIIFASFKIGKKVITDWTTIIIATISTIVCCFIHSPYVFPFVLIIAGLWTGMSKKNIQSKRPKIEVQWANFFLWIGVLLFSALLGYLTSSIHVRLFENFYRNGSLIFGGGQVLVPLLYTEFVNFKNYLSSEEFLSGFALVQAMPGPVFSFSAYIGALSLKGTSVFSQIMGAFMASVGVFLPGTFLIFFVIRFWDSLKAYEPIKKSLKGINAAASGMIIAAAFILFIPLASGYINILLIIFCFGLLNFTKIPAPLIVIGGLIAGFIF